MPVDIDVLIVYLEPLTRLLLGLDLSSRLYDTTEQT